MYTANFIVGYILEQRRNYRVVIDCLQHVSVQKKNCKILRDILLDLKKRQAVAQNNILCVGYWCECYPLINFEGKRKLIKAKKYIIQYIYFRKQYKENSFDNSNKNF